MVFLRFTHVDKDSLIHSLQSECSASLYNHKSLLILLWWNTDSIFYFYEGDCSDLACTQLLLTHTHESFYKAVRSVLAGSLGPSTWLWLHQILSNLSPLNGINSYSQQGHESSPSCAVVRFSNSCQSPGDRSQVAHKRPAGWTQPSTLFFLAAAPNSHLTVKE